MFKLLLDLAACLAIIFAGVLAYANTTVDKTYDPVTMEVVEVTVTTGNCNSNCLRITMYGESFSND